MLSFLPDKHFISTLLFLAFLWLSASPLFASVHYSDNEQIEALIRIFDQDEEVLNRKYSVKNSDEYFERFEAFYTEWSNRLDVQNYIELTQSGKVDYQLLKSHIKRRVYFLERDRKQFKDIKQWLPDRNATFTHG